MNTKVAYENHVHTHLTKLQSHLNLLIRLYRQYAIYIPLITTLCEIMRMKLHRNY